MLPNYARKLRSLADAMDCNARFTSKLAEDMDIFLNTASAPMAAVRPSAARRHGSRPLPLRSAPALFAGRADARPPGCLICLRTREGLYRRRRSMPPRRVCRRLATCLACARR